jgi:hypothetical protein
MYENGKMRPTEIILRMREERQRRIIENVNLSYTVRTFVNVNVSPVQ